MAKALDSPYMPGNRGKLWFKIKPAETVDCVIVAADRGSGRRRGWLSTIISLLPTARAASLRWAKLSRASPDKEFTGDDQQAQRTAAGG